MLSAVRTQSSRVDLRVPNPDVSWSPVAGPPGWT
jgi:hypothetical protein